MNYNNFMQFNPFANMSNPDYSRVIKMWTDNMSNFKPIDFSKFWNSNQEQKHSFDPNEHMSNYMKNFDGLNEVTHMFSEQLQEVMKRKMEMLQKLSLDIVNLMKETMNCSTPEMAMSKHADYARTSIETMMNDYKELAENYSKLSMQAFETLSNKISDNISKFNKKSGSCEASSKKSK